MTKATASHPPGSERDHQPPDIVTMRAVAALLLVADAPLPRYEDLEQQIVRLRGLLRHLINEVEPVAGALAPGDAPREVALEAMAAARRPPRR